LKLVYLEILSVQELDLLECTIANEDEGVCTLRTDGAEDIEIKTDDYSRNWY
jgi:hypothetical protein